MRCVFNTPQIHILSNWWISDNYRTNFDKDITKKLGFFLIRLGSLDQKKHIMIIITQDTSSQTNLHIEYDLLKFDSSLQLALVKVLWSGLFMILPAIRPSQTCQGRDMHADQQVSVVSNLTQLFIMRRSNIIRSMNKRLQHFSQVFILYRSR